MENEKKQYPEGHFINMWMGIGIAIFTGVGVPLSIITGNPGMLGIGPAVGVAFGLAIGAGIEEKKKKAGLIRPLTEEERKRKKVALTAAVVILTVLALLGLLLFLKLI